MKSFPPPKNKKIKKPEIIIIMIIIRGLDVSKAFGDFFNSSETVSYPAGSSRINGRGME